jgi:hypothetical protein
MIDGGETLAMALASSLRTHIQISVLMAASMIIKRYLCAAGGTGFALAGCGSSSVRASPNTPRPPRVQQQQTLATSLIYDCTAAERGPMLLLLAGELWPTANTATYIYVHTSPIYT